MRNKSFTAKKLILIVEDDKDCSDSLRINFARRGYEVVQAFDGKEGLDIALEFHPDIILLDLMMPKMSGMELLRELRGDLWGKDAKVLIHSNVANVNTIIDAEDMGANGYMIKANWQVSDLVKRVSTYF